MRRLLAVLVLTLLAPVMLLSPVVLLSQPAAAQQAPPPPVLTGTIDGSDGRAVNALLGFDWLDAWGRRLDRHGCVQSPQCPLPSYGTVVRVNPSLGATGTPDRAGATTTFSVQPPPGAAQLLLEAYPQNENYRTDEARYGHAMRHSVRLPHRGPLSVRLPLVLCDEGGRVGTLRGTGTRAGRPLALKRVVAWSLESYDPVTRPVLGWNIGTASADGTFTVPNLVGDQRYQLWVTAADGTVHTSFGVRVPVCGQTSVAMDFPPPSGSTAPPPAPILPRPVITAGEAAVVEGAAAPGATVELLVTTRSDPTPRVVRRSTASPSGHVTFRVLPVTNTELRLRTPGAAAGAPALLLVRAAVSAAVRRVAPLTYTVTGQVRPGRSQRVALYQRTADGRRLLATGQARSDGGYTISRRFLSRAVLDLFVISRADELNAEGVSPVRRTRIS